MLYLTTEVNGVIQGYYSREKFNVESAENNPQDRFRSIDMVEHNLEYRSIEEVEIEGNDGTGLYNLYEIEVSNPFFDNGIELFYLWELRADILPDD